MNEPIMKQSKDQNTTTTARLLAWATGIEVAGGLLAVGYYLRLQGALRAVCDGLLGIRPLSLPVEPTWYRRVTPIPLHGGCVSCHAGFNPKPSKTPKLAGLTISMPVIAEESSQP